ncbi:hypothetical protein HZB05_01995 [Candidatus Wolfebacteria bacterium]|nr:hypothetical protein [Candidatus Wolfebacteria bacterium]
MLTATFGGLKIARVLLDEVDGNEISELKKKFSYVFAVVYKKIEEGQDLSDFRVCARRSAVIDLKPDMEQIFNKFESNTRKEIRQARKEQDFLFVSADTNFRAIYWCYKKFELARHWLPTPRSEMKQQIFFTAYHKNKIVSGISCYGHNEILRVAKIFSIRHQGDKQITNALLGHISRNIIFEICKYGKEHGYFLLDLGGVDFLHTEKIGISRFKMSFGSGIIDTSICRFMTPAFVLVKKIGYFFKKDIA